MNPTLIRALRQLLPHIAELDFKQDVHCALTSKNDSSFTSSSWKLMSSLQAAQCGERVAVRVSGTFQSSTLSFITPCLKSYHDGSNFALLPDMTAKLLRLKLPSKLLAQVKARELRRHFEAEVLGLPCDIQPGDGDRMIGKSFLPFPSQR